MYIAASSRGACGRATPESSAGVHRHVFASAHLGAGANLRSLFLRYGRAAVVTAHGLRGSVAFPHRGEVNHVAVRLLEADAPTRRASRLARNASNSAQASARASPGSIAFSAFRALLDLESDAPTEWILDHSDSSRPELAAAAAVRRSTTSSRYSVAADLVVAHACGDRSAADSRGPERSAGGPKSGRLSQELSHMARKRRG